MDTQKIENSLNLAFDATVEEREKSMNLNVGYDETEDVWEVIVKYDRDTLDLLEEGYNVINLLQNYGIVKGSKTEIERLAAYSQIEYIEKPKRLFFERISGKIASGISSIQETPLALRGKGVIIGILDSGIDYKCLEFRKEDGNTRILNLWDQTAKASAPEEQPPMGYNQGIEYTSDDINRALEEGRDLESVDTSGHGTEVATIAAGKTGVAPESDIVIVKLGIPQERGFPRTTELMQGVDYLIRQGKKYQKPVSINISIGNTYGSHDGSSLLERFLDDAVNSWKVSICVGMGNEGRAAGHTQGNVQANIEEKLELLVDRRQVSFDLQLWKYYEDDMEIAMVSPSGKRISFVNNKLGTQRYILGDTEILLYYGEPSPYNIRQEIYIMFIPLNQYVDSGVWELIFSPISIVTGAYSCWLPSSVVLNQGTQFASSVKEGTFTIPSTALGVISVGAYDNTTLTYADFSGRGEQETPLLVKPDIVAPGVRIMTVTKGCLERMATGTSFATPFVTGACGLLMEWGVVRGNDKYLYGEKVKAYLRAGAGTLPGFEKYPNVEVGYGKLDLKNTIENNIVKTYAGM